MRHSCVVCQTSLLNQNVSPVCQYVFHILIPGTGTDGGSGILVGGGPGGGGGVT